MTITAITKLTCPACGLCFPTRKKLGNHWGAQHKGTLAGSKFCPVCGKCFFPTTYSRWQERRTCSCTCANQSHMRYMTLSCPNCARTFSRQRSRALRIEQPFCSQACYFEWVKEDKSRGWKGGKVEVACAFCGKPCLRWPFELIASKKFYCSQECQDLWRSKHVRGPNGSHWTGGKLTVACTWCGKPCPPCWASAITDSGNHFCSAPCYAKWQFEHRRGPNHPGWKGGASSLRGLWLQQEGRQWRRQALTCQAACGICGVQPPILPHVHHALSFALYPAYRSRPENALVVCEECHEWLHRREGKGKRLELERELCADLNIRPRESLREQRQLCAVGIERRVA